MHVTSAVRFSCQKQYNNKNRCLDIVTCMYLYVYVMFQLRSMSFKTQLSSCFWIRSLVSWRFYCMHADCNYDDDCQLSSRHLPQDCCTWPIRYGLHLGPKQWAAWRGPSNYHVRPPAAQLRGGDDQYWTRFLRGLQDFQSLRASMCFLCSNCILINIPKSHSSPPHTFLDQTCPMNFTDKANVDFSLNNYCACNKWFVWLYKNCLCEWMLLRGKKEDAKTFWLCIGQHMWFSDRKVHV